ncbi:MAG: AzlC family ABC transporter permease [Syntrophobacter sp.]
MCRNRFWIKDFASAFKDALPLMFGLIPFGLAYGILSRHVGLTWPESFLMSLAVFAGASQFSALSLMQNGIEAGLIVFTTFLINMRHFLMSASLAPYLRDQGFARRALLAFGIADESYALSITRFMRTGSSWSYLLGANSAIYVAWALTSGAGALLSGLITDPLKWGLDFAMPATFMVLLVPQLKSWKEFSVCAISATTAVIGSAYLPGKWFIIIATLAAISHGWIVETVCDRK